MGCSHSTSADKKVTHGAGRSRSSVMTKTEIDQRIDSIRETCSATFGGVRVRYAYLSQRGYYPDGKRRDMSVSCFFALSVFVCLLAVARGSCRAPTMQAYNLIAVAVGGDGFCSST